MEGSFEAAALVASGAKESTLKWGCLVFSFLLKKETMGFQALLP